jgi:hypothetical protein
MGKIKWPSRQIKHCFKQHWSVNAIPGIEEVLPKCKKQKNIILCNCCIHYHPEEWPMEAELSDKPTHPEDVEEERQT